MKKIQAILLLVCLWGIVLLSACNTAPPPDVSNAEPHYVTLVNYYDWKDPYAKVEYPIEQPKDSVKPKRLDAPQVESIQVMGVTYTGTYSHSTKYYNHYWTDHYVGEYVSFSLHHDTRVMHGFSFSPKDADFEEIEAVFPEVSDPAQAALTLAEQLAGDYIPVHEYSEKSLDGPHLSKGVSYYIVTYTREISGCEAADYLSFTITTKGHLWRIDANSLGDFANVDLTIDNERLQKNIDDKINTIYGEDLRGYKIWLQRLIFLQDGTIAVRTIADVRWITENPEEADGTMEREIYLLTFLDGEPVLP